jgi:hypothetical protein
VAEHIAISRRVEESVFAARSHKPGRVGEVQEESRIEAAKHTNNRGFQRALLFRECIHSDTVFNNVEQPRLRIEETSPAGYILGIKETSLLN